MLVIDRFRVWLPPSHHKLTFPAARTHPLPPTPATAGAARTPAAAGRGAATLAPHCAQGCDAAAEGLTTWPAVVAHLLAAHPELFEPAFSAEADARGMFRVACEWCGKVHAAKALGDARKEANKCKAGHDIANWHACPYPGCGVVMKKKQNLDKHAATHAADGGRRFPCPHRDAGCDYTATKQSDVKRHVGNVHEGRADHVCPVADCPRHTKGFTRASDMRRHMESAHPTYVGGGGTGAGAGSESE